MKNAILIFNHRSGSYKKNTLDKITKKLRNSGMELEVVDINDYKNAWELVSSLDYKKTPLIIIAGGDGTISSVCNAVLNLENYSKFAVAIIPIGTANVLAIELGIASINKALKNIINSNVESINIGEVIGPDIEKPRYFILMASAGLDSWAVVKLNEQLKAKIGKLAYVVSFLKVLFTRIKPPCYTIINGKKHKNIFTCVCNDRYYAGRIKISKKLLNQKIFNTIILNRISLFSTINHLIAMLFNRDYKDKKIRTINSDSVRIESKINDYPLQIDGDYFCNLPVDIKISKKSLNMIK